jgi:hypothetical protein
VINTAQQLVSGRAKVQSIDQAGRVAHDFGWTKNIILNTGMDAVANRYWADCFTNCALGNNDTPTIIQGGATTISQSNVTVTLSGGSFVFTNTATDAGKVIRFASGGSVRIVSVQSSTSATVNLSQVIASTSFSVYQTTQTALFGEQVRSSELFAGPGACGTDLTLPGTAVMKRTFDFPTQPRPDSAFYREIGLSWLSAPGSQLFSRMVLSADVEIKPTFFPRVIYEFRLILTPGVPTAKTAVFDGWPVLPSTSLGAEECIEDWGIAVVNASGASVPGFYDGSVPILSNEPSALADVLIGLDTQALAPISGSSAPNRWAAGSAERLMANEPYVSGTFTRFRTVILDVNEAVSQQLRVFSMGHIVTPGARFHPVYTMLFDENQTKTGAESLSARFALRWARNLDVV